MIQINKTLIIINMSKNYKDNEYSVSIYQIILS